MVFGWFKKKQEPKPQGTAAPKWDMSQTLKEAQEKNKKTNAKKPVKKPCAKCEAKKQEVKLVEFVEIVMRDKEGSVVNPGKEAAKKYTKVFTRTDKCGSTWKQYINLDKDLDGKTALATDATKRRPDFGPYVELRARVEWVTGDKTRSLAGKTVYFGSQLTKGRERRPASLNAAEDYGFGSAGGTKDKHTATTGADGWTSVVKFYLSQYAGDEFKLTAQADAKNKGKPSGTKLTIGKYIVWRKFWYQTTRFTGAALPDPSKSIACYREVCADMVGGTLTDVTYTKGQLDAKEAGISAHTLYPEHMCIEGKTATTNRVIIGRHNEKAIRKFLTTNVKEPIKMHLMYCDCQWDPENWSNAISKVVPHGLDTTTTTSSGACVKPALQGDLLSGAEWFALSAAGLPNGQHGVMDDSFIVIPKNRSGQFNEIEFKLPANVVSKSTGGGIRLVFKIAKAGVYLGDSDGYQITIASDRDDTRVNATIAHEIGHAFWQSPKYEENAAHLPKSFNNTEKGKLKVYADAGYHCSYQAVVWGTLYQQGTCVLATRSNKNKGKYCTLCKPFVRLQDMSEGGMKTSSR